ncbi:unnamed protein product [Bursaphelenchus xylophilus]|uniref:RING finger protein 207 n=1 Tax=Bursaphelenchus xylophilus TaxID=6326 RepID=A0A1I7RSV2_BURXY|nr:unnamed protein product [Bursaphelenchus xylophilus]CAG9122792.1 unnamed protein product [Bursaphelenchus xylophilus]
MGENAIISSELNPLKCAKCLQELNKPIRLPCQHCYCMECIRYNTECPTCSLPFDSNILKIDPILNYLLDSAKELTEPCANCDQCRHPMFFCETCQQPLCHECRLSTHQAKIFSSHQILPLEESGRLRGNLQCKEHKSPYVLFCSESKSLMCIECFNGSSVDKRNHFLSIEVAHKSCQDRLNESVKLLKSFQNDLKEQIEVRKSAQEQVHMNSDNIQKEIEEQYEIMVEKIKAVKMRVIERVKMTENDKTNQIAKQIKTLINIEAPIKLNLLSASVFCSYASQLDLLHSFSSILDNIKLILAQKMEKIPSDGFGTVNFVGQFVSSVENELDFPKPQASHTLQQSVNQLSLQLFNNNLNEVEEDSESSKGSYASYAFRNMILRDPSCVLEYGSTTFNEQLQRVENPLKDFVNERNHISNTLLEVQRDITKRRCIVDKTLIEELTSSCESLNARLDGHLQVVDEVEGVLQDLWMEQFDLLRRQNAIFQQKKEELASLQRFSQQILDAVVKVKTVSKFLSSVISVVDERRSGTTAIPPMEQICMQILTLSPDSKQRCEAIEKEEENRRLAKEKEKLLTQKEVRQLPKNLKETPKKARPVSMIMIENSRDRQPVPLILKKKKRTKRNSQSDESSGIRSPSPKGLFSSATSLDTISLNAGGFYSPTSLSPVPQKEKPITEEMVRSTIKTKLESPTIPGPSMTSPPVSPIVKPKPQIPLPPITPPRLEMRPPPPPPSPKIPDGGSNAISSRPETPKTPKSLQYGASLGGNTPSEETIKAREMLLQSIKERVKRID